MSSSSSLDCLELCRLCLEKERVSVPIFENEGDVRQIFLKITACLPVKVSRDDKLPKKICDDCLYKVELFYQFWNTTANAEKQLLQWLGEVGGLEDGVPEVLVSNVMKQEQASDSRLEGRVVQVGGQNSVDMGMIENMTIITMPLDGEQQFASVPMDTSGTVTVQAVASSSASANDQSQTSVSHLADEVEDDDDDDDDDGCDNEGMPVKEENEEDQSDRVLDQSSFVTIPCDEAGPSGLQQKIADISNMSLQPTEVNDPKTGASPRRPYKKQNLKKYLSALELTKSNETDAADQEVLTLPRKYLRTIAQRKIIKTEEDSSAEESSAAADSSLLVPKMEPVCQIDEIQDKPVVVKRQKRKKNPIVHITLPNGRFACKNCKQEFSQRFRVRQHYNIHHAPRVFHQCPFCDKSYLSRYMYNIHVNTTHRENSSDYFVCCDKCEYRAKNKHYLKAHQIRRHSGSYDFECDICKKRFKMKVDLKGHMGVHNTLDHMCDACGRMYPTQDSLNKHVRVYHVNTYEFRCPVCNQKLLTKENLENHMKRHQTKYSCDQCDFTFTKKHYLTRHKKRVHDVIKNYVCEVCGKAFVCSATLRVHYLTHTKMKPYLCNVCGLRFTQRSSMMLHWRKKHPDAEEPPPPVILTNFFGIESEVQRLTQANSRS